VLVLYSLWLLGVNPRVGLVYMPYDFYILGACMKVGENKVKCM